MRATSTAPNAIHFVILIYCHATSTHIRALVCSHSSALLCERIHLEDKLVPLLRSPSLLRAMWRAMCVQSTCISTHRAFDWYWQRRQRLHNPIWSYCIVCVRASCNGKFIRRFFIKYQFIPQWNIKLHILRAILAQEHSIQPSGCVCASKQF